MWNNFIGLFSKLKPNWQRILALVVIALTLTYLPEIRTTLEGSEQPSVVLKVLTFFTIILVLSHAEVWTALRRGIRRITCVLATGLVFIYAPENYPLTFGPIAAPLMRGFGLVLAALAVADACVRIMQPYFDTGEAARRGLRGKDGTDKGDQAAAMIYLARNILFGIVIIMFVTAARAAPTPQMPDNAKKNSPLLLQERASYWISMEQVSLLAAQIEQETCVSLKSTKCWTSQARLKTHREEGVAFGQLTRVWRSDGSLRFDNLTAIVLRHPVELKGYNWNNWDDPQLSMRAYVLFMRDTCKNIKNAATGVDMFQMCLSAYNGGEGGLKSDRLSCRATPGCNPNVWMNNVEKTSLKSKTAVPGYGQSAFAINRGYVRNVSLERRVRYLILDKLINCDTQSTASHQQTV